MRKNFFVTTVLCLMALGTCVFSSCGGDDYSSTPDYIQTYAATVKNATVVSPFAESLMNYFQEKIGDQATFEKGPDSLFSFYTTLSKQNELKAKLETVKKDSVEIFDMVDEVMMKKEQKYPLPGFILSVGGRYSTYAITYNYESPFIGTWKGTTDDNTVYELTLSQDTSDPHTYAAELSVGGKKVTIKALTVTGNFFFSVKKSSTVYYEFDFTSYTRDKELVANINNSGTKTYTGVHMTKVEEETE